MIWRSWTIRQLQEAINEFDESLIDKLRKIIPAISIEEYDPTELDKRANLIKILEAFSPSDCFSKRNYMRLCLDRLPADELNSLCRNLGLSGVDFDDKVKKIVSKRWSENSFAEKFLSHFNLPEHFLPPQRVDIPTEVDIHPPSAEVPLEITSPYKPLKDFQFQVFNDSISKLEAPRSRFVIQMPTGSGKTRTSMEFITDYFRNADDGAIVVWLAHSSELCEQSFLCFYEVWSHVSNKKLKACRCWGSHGVPPPYDTTMFVVAGFQKLHSSLKSNPDVFKDLKSRIGLIIVDEAHKAVAPTYKEVIHELKGSSTRIVGLTATPGRSDPEETEEMAELFFGGKVNIRVPNGTSEIDMLKERKILAKIDYVPLITRLDFVLTAAQKRSLKKTFDFPKSFVEKVGRDLVRNTEIMMRLIQSCNEGRRILFFSCSVKHSKFITALLIYFGIKAAHVDGSTAPARRQQSIAEFKTGKIQVLCNYGVLTTGFDAPNTDEVFISRPTNSVVLYSQMIGRGLRGPEIGGTEKCQITDVRDNITGFGDQDRVYRWFDDYWDN